MSAKPKPALAEIKAAFENFRGTSTNNEKHAGRNSLGKRQRELVGTHIRLPPVPLRTISNVVTIAGHSCLVPSQLLRQRSAYLPTR